MTTRRGLFGWLVGVAAAPAIAQDAIANSGNLARGGIAKRSWAGGRPELMMPLHRSPSPAEIKD